MTRIPIVSSSEDTTISQSPGVATPSSTGASDEQKGIGFLYDSFLIDTLLSIREEKLRDRSDLINGTGYGQAEVPGSDSTPSSHPRHSRVSAVPSRSSQTQQPHAKNKPSSYPEDMKSLMDSLVASTFLSWNRIRDWMATGTRADAQEALRLPTPQTRKDAGDSSPKTSSGDRGVLPSPDPGNCVVSHENFATLLRMIHDSGKPEAFYRRELETMEGALEVQVTKARDEKARADSLEVRLQDMQALDNSIQEWREEKNALKRETEEARREIEHLIMKPFITLPQPSKAENPEVKHGDIKKLRSKLNGFEAARAMTDTELEKLRDCLCQLRAELEELRSQNKLELDNKPVDGQGHTADDDRRVHDLETQLRNAQQEKLELYETMMWFEKQLPLLRDDIIECKQHSQSLTCQLQNSTYELAGDYLDLQKRIALQELWIGLLHWADEAIARVARVRENE